MVFQLRSSSVSISTNEGEGPHSTHTVTPAPPDEAAVESSSLETSRNGTVGLFTGRKTGVSCKEMTLKIPVFKRIIFVLIYTFQI